MSFTIDYRPQLPHGPSWAVGYPVDMSCKTYHKYALRELPNEGKGPPKGVQIVLRGLPTNNNQRVYVRFWAARGGGHSWDSAETAYSSPPSSNDRGDYEREPPLDYPNGGLVKANKNGKTHFRIHLPAGYQSDHGKVNPHLHYRLCIDGIMGPVQTQYFCHTRSANHNLLIFRDAQSLGREQRGVMNRLYQ